MTRDDEGYSKRCPICEALPAWPHAEWCDFRKAVTTEPPARFLLTSDAGGTVTVTGTVDLCAALVRMVTSGHKVTVEQIPGKWRVYWGNIEVRHADFYDYDAAKALADHLRVLRHGGIHVEELNNV